VDCGFDLRTGAKLQGPKKATAPPRRAARAGKGGVSPDELPGLLDDAAAVRAKAREILDTPLPILTGIRADPDTFALRAQRRLLRNRCANPHCKGQLVLPRLAEDPPDWSDREADLVPVSFSVGGKKLRMLLCWQCSAEYKLQQQARLDTLRGLLKTIYEMLRQAAKQYPNDTRIRKNLSATELLASEADLKLGGRCFIATAAHGSPLAEQVQVLRRFRDEVLLRSSAGRRLVRAYCRISPPLATLLRKTRWGRAAVRWLLQPLVLLCQRKLERCFPVARQEHEKPATPG
jgi:hypothetical protein